METTGLIAAMPLERDALLRRLPGWQRFSAGPLRGQRLELRGKTLLLVTSGMGERRAGEAARSLIEAGGARVLISFGIAGAVEADLRIGDVILGEACSRLAEGLPGPCLPLAPYPPAARIAAAQALAQRGARVLSGTVITTGGAQASSTQLADLPRPVLEMETAGIAMAAAATGGAQNGVPLYAIRAISDGPAAPIPFDLGAMMDGDANLRAGELLRAVIRRPGMLPQLWSMARNSRLAAENAAVAVTAALGELP